MDTNVPAVGSANPTQILFYTRPWEVAFHLELARQLGDYYPQVPIRFVTFFDWAAKRVRLSGYDVIYMPTQLKGCVAQADHSRRLAAVDQMLFARFGVGLNLLAQSERFMPKGRQEAEDFIRRHTVLLDSIVSDRTLSISSMFDHFIYWLGGALANARGGWHFAFAGNALPRGTVLGLRSPWEAWRSLEIGDGHPTTIEAIRTQIADPNVPIEYMEAQQMPSLHRRFIHRIGVLLAERHDQREGSYFSNFSWRKFLFGQRIFCGFADQERPVYSIDSDDNLDTWCGQNPFFYVPLHMEPEATILMYSPWLRDQLEMCRLLSQSLPLGTALLVKENPKMDGMRPISYYDTLASLPGVRLVSPKVSSLALIRKATGVISLAGSASFEAALLGKPAMVLARPPFRAFFKSADFADEEGLSLAAIGKWMRAPSQHDLPTLEKLWADWRDSTFAASAVPQWMSDGSYELDASAENVAGYCRFILGSR